MAKKSSYTRKSPQVKDPELQKWLLNLVIFCLAVVVFGFIFSMSKRMFHQTEKVVLSQSIYVPPSQKPYAHIVVEVLNGCGTAGLAQKFTNYLRQQGVDVIYTGNADNMNYARTLLVLRNDADEKGQTVMHMLQFGSDRILRQPDPSLHVDLSLILGKDFQSLPIYSKIQSIGEY